MRLVLFCFMVFVSSVVFGQNKEKSIDSLLQVAEKSNDSTRLRIYNKVSFYYIFNAPETAKKLLEKGIEEAALQNNYFSEAELTNTYGIYYDVRGQSDSARYYFEKAYDLSARNNQDIITVMVINNLGMFHWNKGQYQEALDYFFKALKMNNEMSKAGKDGTYLNNIGLIYQEMGLTDKALEYHYKALSNRRKNNAVSEIPVSLNNIGINLTEKKKYTEAEKALNEGIELAREANELGVYYNLLSSLSNVYVRTNQTQKAIPILEESFEGRSKNNIDRRANLHAIVNLIQIFTNERDALNTFKYIKEGETYRNEFPELTNASANFYEASAKAYYAFNDVENGARYLSETLRAKDSIFSHENASNIATLETKFNFSEKERMLAETRANLAERELQVRNKNLLIYGGIALLMLLGLLGYLLFKHQQNKHRQLQKEAELKTALARIETQNRLQEQRLRISRDLHDNIGAQLTFIISSIDSLKYKLQDASEATITKLSGISAFTKSTIYELRDTIWAMNKNTIALEDLQVRISNFIDNARDASQHISFQFKGLTKYDKEITFASVEGMNLYRIIQEGVNNALKHANATQISVSLTQENETYILKITDDGIGFSSAKEDGNGLHNIRKRVNELGGSFTIASEKEKGTTLKVQF
ncbi:tetratricopeptide repeat-containing sensor histidine kinase [Cochleicola gelatinilyticus]|nr:tetratricopeptide repeat protein [Cochleicola gelatinilyticus]